MATSFPSLSCKTSKLPVKAGCDLCHIYSSQTLWLALQVVSPSDEPFFVLIICEQYICLYFSPQYFPHTPDYSQNCFYGNNYPEQCHEMWMPIGENLYSYFWIPSKILFQQLSFNFSSQAAWIKLLIKAGCDLLSTTPVHSHFDEQFKCSRFSTYNCTSYRSTNTACIWKLHGNIQSNLTYKIQICRS